MALHLARPEDSNPKCGSGVLKRRQSNRGECWCAESQMGMPAGSGVASLPTQSVFAHGSVSMHSRQNTAPRVSRCAWVMCSPLLHHWAQSPSQPAGRHGPTPR